jgi:dTDP-N-acetylfucosamine:lipid II N-acetylfucosaminyltransferase
VVGNSATASNRHLPLLARLADIDTAELTFVLPLSYGDRAYAAQVSAAWQQRFAERCECLTEFMPLERYTAILNGVDAGLYDFERQQGLGNILMLLALGKRVYLHEDAQTSLFLRQLGFAVHALEDFARDVRRPLTEADVTEAQANIRLCQVHFSDAACKRAWSRILAPLAAENTCPSLSHG